MGAGTYLVFVGPSASLATELLRLPSRIANLNVIAIAARKNDRGLNETSISDALSGLHSQLLLLEKQTENARLVVWFYDNYEAAQLTRAWHAFGRAAWIELVPEALKHKDRATREYIEKRMKMISELLHEISGNVFHRRRKSPLSLPLSNFNSDITLRLDSLWYRGLDKAGLLREIRRLKDSFSRVKSTDPEGYRDERKLLFKPALPNEEHGIAHPIGSSPRCFVSGRFRFGVSLAPGFHYDVRPEIAKRLLSTLIDCDGTRRDLGPERKRYINIHPNDYLRPEK